MDDMLMCKYARKMPFSGRLSGNGQHLHLFMETLLEGAGRSLIIY